MAAALFGAIFLGWMPAHLALLRDLRPHGERLTYMLFLAVWGCDSSAYLVGSAFGKHPLAARISPRKTWEGAAAGCLAAGLVVFAFRAASPGLLSVPRALLVAASIGILGQLSDLVESLIKRSLGAKDSGALLPGHGGMLDRFDSLLLAAPAVYYCLTL
ncbi:MAG: phosphatidate cytidylyltransferase, partial [Elusimicrobia bacterium]|nr:phosphatidate cytidylyltransferase [Elusimicrobiota bacterium]